MIAGMSGDKIFPVKPAPDRAGWTRISFLKYKLSDNVLYLNFSNSTYCEAKKAKPQRETLVGLALKRTEGTF
jgi:hypothetical protein